MPGAEFTGGAFAQLTYLNLSRDSDADDDAYGGITGSLPASYGMSLPNLETLDLASNQLTGSLPDGELHTHFCISAAPGNHTL